MVGTQDLVCKFLIEKSVFFTQKFPAVRQINQATCTVSMEKELLPDHSIMSQSLSSAVRTLLSTCVRTNEAPEKRPRRQKFPCSDLTLRLREKKKSSGLLSPVKWGQSLSLTTVTVIYLSEMRSAWSTFVKKSYRKKQGLSYKISSQAKQLYYFDCWAGWKLHLPSLQYPHLQHQSSTLQPVLAGQQ